MEAWAPDQSATVIMIIELGCGECIRCAPEADEFSAALLMPFHDFRRQLPAKARADFETLSRLANRCGVSLTAANLRWLEFTESLKGI
jgi:hypothetical protein